MRITTRERRSVRAAFCRTRRAWTILPLLLIGAGCSKFDLLNSAVPNFGYTLTADRPYGPLARQKLDIYRPDRAAANAPVVVFFYGGEWKGGSKRDYRFVGQALASRGFVAVLPDYRLYPRVTFPAFVRDGALSIRWVHDQIRQYGGDPTAIFLMGHSAGAHIAALLTLDGSYLRAVGLNRNVIRGTVAMSGPYDFVPPAYDCAIFRMRRGSRPNRGIEPVNFVDGREPPMLLMDGLKDRIVPPVNTFELADRIERSGGEVHTILYRDLDHVDMALALAWPFRWIAPVLDDAAAFIRARDAASVRSRTASPARPDGGASRPEARPVRDTARPSSRTRSG